MRECCARNSQIGYNSSFSSLPPDLELFIISHFVPCADALHLKGITDESKKGIHHEADIHALLVKSGFGGIPQSWRTDCTHEFHNSLHTFRPPYDKFGTKFVVHTPNTVAFMRFSICFSNLAVRADLIGRDAVRNGIYIEICTSQLDDLVSLSLVDFDGDGRASLTFCPEMGTVIQEERISSPASSMKTIKGKFCNILSKVEWGWSYENEPAYIALFFSLSGEVTFFRKQIASDQWESTGVISKSQEWVTGRGLITPCIAFGSPGEYNIKICKVQTIIPFYAEVAPKPHESKCQWTDIMWSQMNARPRMETDTPQESETQSGEDASFDNDDAQA